ncbi:MAG: DUF3796 domain-containing protein [Candidatus Methanosuratincola sp.]
MRRNAIGYLSLLGLLGLLGLVAGNEGFYGFFGFFGFMSAFRGKGTDERVNRNVDRACRNSFLYIMLAAALFIAYIASLRAAEAFPLAFAALFAGGIVMFVVSFVYYNERGD